MNPAFQQVKEIFLASLEKAAPGEREAFLGEACGANEPLRRQVEALLRQHEQAGSFLEPPPAAEPGDTGAVAPGRWLKQDDLAAAPQEGPGTRIGPYKLLQPIGEGGMGVVYVAEQEQPVKRRVALKIIKPGMDSAQVVARFEQERQALALMDHTHIAKVLDAGTTESGRPYFVMELVKGVPITKYCDELHLPIRERLELFVPVCQAIQHAHQKGVIHRDIKPSNVLVCMQDGKPVAKVIDFGVAKATAQKLTERTLMTAFGAVVGTLEYMSPEQAELNALDIDTRADVYCLGVLLYELLTGSTPLDRKRLRQAAFTEMLRIIKEEEPPKPSTRLTQSRESLASLAAQRRTEPAKLTREVRGELDWIVMKALEKDRTRRYETANGLAHDVERYLHDEPVAACPPSAGYRLRKYARKHRAAFVTAAGFAGLLLLGTVVSTWQAVRATRAEQAAVGARDAEMEQRQDAERQRDRATQAEADATRERDKAVAEKKRADDEAAVARAVNEFLQKDLLGQADIGNQPGGDQRRDPDVKVRELLDRAAKAIKGKFVQQPLTEAAIRLTLGDAYQALGRYAEAQPHLERSVRLRSAQLGDGHPDTLRSKNSLAKLYLAQAKDDQAEMLLQEMIAGYTAKLGADDPDTLNTKNSLALLCLAQGKYEQAEALFKEVIAAQTAQLGADHPDTLTTKHNLAGLYARQGNYDRAEPLFKEVLAGRTTKLAADHPDTLRSKHNLAVLYGLQGKYDLAVSLFKELLDYYIAQRRADHPDTLTIKNNLALMYMHQGKYDQAEPLFQEALAGQTTKLAADHPATLRSKHNLAWLYQAQGRYDRAETLHKEALAGRTAKLGADHPDTLVSKNNLAELYRVQGKFDLAEPLLQEALAGRTAKLGADHPDTLTSMNNLAALYNAQGKYDRAEPLLRDCLTLGVQKQPDSWTTFDTQSLLGGSLLGQKKYADAEPLLLSGYEGLKQRENTIPAIDKGRLTEVLERLVQLYDATGQKDKADEWRKQLDARRMPPKGAQQ
jgi:serine/threonine protein kinase/tetratricopeptide (TPR) repeat protein